MTLRDRVRVLIAEGNSLDETISVCRAENPSLKPHRIREAYNIIAGGGLCRDRRSIHNDFKPRPLDSIWNALRQRDASHAEELRKAVTLPKLKFLEKELEE